MQSEIKISSSLSALRQRVRDGVAESDFAGLARLAAHREAWQTAAADPIICAYMAPVWAYGLAPAPGFDIIGGLEHWCPALPAADYALGILYADGICSRAGRRSIRRWAAPPVGGCFHLSHRTPCWPAPPQDRTGPNLPWPPGGENKSGRVFEIKICRVQCPHRTALLQHKKAPFVGTVL